MYFLNFYKTGKLENRYKADPVSGDILENIPVRSRIDNVRDIASMYKTVPLVVTYEINPNVKDITPDEAIEFTPNNIAVQKYSGIILQPKDPKSPYNFVLGEALKNSKSGEEHVSVVSEQKPSLKGNLHVKVLYTYTKRW